jgi:hypothetical protein
LIFKYFSKISLENTSLIKIWQKLRLAYIKTYVYFWRYLTELFLEWEMFQTEHIFLFNNSTPPRLTPKVAPFVR